MSDHLNEYLLDFLSPMDNELFLELEEIAIKDRVPIMDPLSINTLMQLIRISKPKKVLEIGTGIGYSALRMLEAYPDMSIVTIERNEKRYNQAVHYIKKFNKQSKIEVIYGDALDKIADLGEQKFDLIFIDAAKGQYKEFFKLSIPMLSNHGLVVSDNVLFKGYIANPSSDEHPRFKNIIEKIRDYNQWVMNHPDFTTTIIPIGDGIAVSVKRFDNYKE